MCLIYTRIDYHCCYFEVCLSVSELVEQLWRIKLKAMMKMDYHKDA